MESLAGFERKAWRENALRFLGISESDGESFSDAKIAEWEKTQVEHQKCVTKVRIVMGMTESQWEEEHKMISRRGYTNPSLKAKLTAAYQMEEKNCGVTIPAQKKSHEDATIPSAKKFERFTAVQQSRSFSMGRARKKYSSSPISSPSGIAGSAEAMEEEKDDPSGRPASTNSSCVPAPFIFRAQKQEILGIVTEATPGWVEEDCGAAISMTPSREEESDSFRRREKEEEGFDGTNGETLEKIVEGNVGTSKFEGFVGEDSIETNPVGDLKEQLDNQSVEKEEATTSGATLVAIVDVEDLIVGIKNVKVH